MTTQILYHQQAKAIIIKGIKTIAKTVAITLGPLGSNVILSKQSGIPQIINSGNNLINEIELQDNLENTGIRLVRQAATKTNDVVNDGTTRTIIIAYSLIYNGMNYITAGINITDLVNGIEQTITFLSEKINEYAQPVESTKSLLQIARIASGDNNIGNIIVQTIEKIGPEGLITLEESQTANTMIDITKGIKLDKGLLSLLFIRENHKIQVIQENSFILITDKKIDSVQDELIPVLELVAKTSRPLLILADGLSSEVLSTLTINQNKGVMNVAAIRTPGFGHQRKLLLEDISLATNGQIISNKIGLRLNSVKLSMLGKADKVVINKNSTTIIIKDESQRINERCKQLRKQISLSNTIYERENLENRLARISGKNAVIKIGSCNNRDLDKKKIQFQEALGSVRAALEEGIIPGGGALSIQLASEILSWAKKSLSQNQLYGAKLVQISLLTPLQTIIENAGQNNNTVLERLKASKFATGYNVIKRDFDNMYQEGIIDSAKVMRLTLQNAASIAKIFLTTECIIIHKKTTNTNH